MTISPSSCTRARVGIDVPRSENEGDASAESQLHIGHARTILLGSLIAEELGIPFDLRLDGLRDLSRSHDVGVLVDLCTIISRLGIKCRNVYWSAQQHATPFQYEWEMGPVWKAVHARLCELLNETHTVLLLIEDDLLYHYPSLMIRGMEFADTGLTQTGTTKRYMEAQRAAYALCGRTMYEINTPLVVEQHRKVSKSVGTGLGWKFFSRFPGAWVRDWLLATAVNPAHPSGVLGETFTRDRLTSRPYEWSWDDWDDYIRTIEG